MPKPLRLCSAALLLAATILPRAQAQATPAVPTASIDQKTLLATARQAYYLPLERHVQGFSCSVAIDWQPLLERARFTLPLAARYAERLPAPERPVTLSFAPSGSL